jgi:aryl-alcohol dehydrogenase-like predicted oxidoreductase
VRYQKLGRTGIEVSVIGFGGAPMGLDDYMEVEDRNDARVRAEAVEAVREAVRLGITYYDTAPSYGDGLSESSLGEALEGCRDDVLIGTKFGFRADSSPEKYEEGLRASLDRLRTDRVDLLQLHGGTFREPLAQTILDSCVFEWLSEMKQKGLCRFAGITAEAPSGALERLLGSGRFDVMQIAYNLIYQAACDYQREPFGVIPLARSLGMGILTMRSTTCGFIQKLIGRAFPGIDTDGLTRLAINFVVSTPEVDCALVGMRKARIVRENVAMVEGDARLDLRELHTRYL